VYEESDYPHRVFQLDVVVAAVCMVLAVRATLTAAAQPHGCGRDSVRRWLRWVASLADPRDLEQLCSRLDSDGLPPPLVTDGGRAAKVTVLLERLVELLLSRGMDLPGRGAGLVRLLLYRLAHFGDVFYLTKSSPPLRRLPGPPLQFDAASLLRSPDQRACYGAGWQFVLGIA
jgi:hypothetical protein